jgi:hypothetical protein
MSFARRPDDDFGWPLAATVIAFLVFVAWMWR